MTGRAVAPWVFRIDPRAQWNRFDPGAGGVGRASRRRPGTPAHRPDQAREITDVAAREIAPPHDPKEKAPDRSV